MNRRRFFEIEMKDLLYFFFSVKPCLEDVEGGGEEHRQLNV